MKKKEEQIITNFITAYKKIENLLGKKGFSVFEYENTLEEESKRKQMQFCRLTRNFLQHEEKLFILPTPQMIEMLEEEYQLILDQEEIVRKRMKKREAIFIEEKISNAAKTLTDRKSFVPIIDKNGMFIGIFNDRSIRIAYGKGKMSEKISSVKELLSSAPICKPEDLLNELDRTKDYIVVDRSGKYKGILIFTLSYYRKKTENFSERKK